MNNQKSAVPSNPMSLALVGVGFRPPVIAANEVPNIAPKRMVVALTKKQFTLVFHCFRKDIPKGVQIAKACGGRTNFAKKGTKLTKLDLNNLLDRVSVDGINVLDSSGHCMVFVNCTVGLNSEGLDFWGKKKGNKVYDEFIHALADCTWGVMQIRNNKEKIVVSLGDYSYQPPATILRFAIEQK
ncbi:MAG: hypothetical protein Q7K40_03440 [bacterium]|nr:hypothetical protein [bacterium]